MSADDKKVDMPVILDEDVPDNFDPDELGDDS